MSSGQASTIMKNGQSLKGTSSNPNSLANIGYTQNFLRDTKLVETLINKSNITSGITVLEIGPGKGIITEALARRVGPTGRVVAVEFDPHLAMQLRARFTDLSQVNIIQQDILSFSLDSLPHNYRVFANVPFNITAKIFHYIFQPLSGPQDAYLIVQKESIQEVGQKKEPRATLKSLFLEPIYQIRLIHTFSPHDFSPPPGVKTALFHFQKKTPPALTAQQYTQFCDFLAFISRDRIGEGSWLRLFSKKDLRSMVEKNRLLWGRGLKSQAGHSLMTAFLNTVAQDEMLQKKVVGALKVLQKEQEKRELINFFGGHHRSKMEKKR